jgi:hypothetical protein
MWANACIHFLSPILMGQGFDKSLASRSDQIATQDLPVSDVSDVSLRLLKESPKSLNVRRT